MELDSSFDDLCPDVEVESCDHFQLELNAEQESHRQEELERPNKFKNYREENRNLPNSIFALPGIKFIQFTHKIIKFTFRPSAVAEMIAERLVFIISLKYRRGFWLPKRDLIPVNYKLRIYRLFYVNISYRTQFRFTDENVHEGIVEIWLLLREWAQNDEKFRKKRCHKYRRGDEMYLDDDDLELYVTSDEREVILQKRREIWNRMLPPNARRRMR